MTAGKCEVRFSSPKHRFTGDITSLPHDPVRPNDQRVE